MVSGAGAGGGCGCSESPGPAYCTRGGERYDVVECLTKACVTTVVAAKQDPGLLDVSQPRGANSEATNGQAYEEGLRSLTCSVNCWWRDGKTAERKAGWPTLVGDS